jgi:hypothetical protein
VIVPPNKEAIGPTASTGTSNRWVARTEQQAADARRRGLQRLAAALGQLRSEVAVITTKSNLLASLEEERPLTSEEKADAKRLKAESRRLYWELRALAREYNAMHRDGGRSR